MMRMALRFGGSLDDSRYSGNGMGQHYTNTEHEVVRRAVALARETGAKDVLDLAAGHGLVAKALCLETDVNGVTATDINRAALSDIAAEAATDKMQIGTDFYDASKPLPPEWKEKFDLVVAKDLYPFLSPPAIRRFLANASAALKPGGWFLLTAPSTRSRLYREGEPVRSRLGIVRRLGQAAKDYIQTTLDFFSFATIESLGRELRRAGLEMTEAKHFGREKGWILAVAQKIPIQGKTSA